MKDIKIKGKKPESSKDLRVRATGKRKTAIAKVWAGSSNKVNPAKETRINGLSVKEYFPVPNLIQKVLLPQKLILSIFQQKQKHESVSAEHFTEVASIKGNKIPVSFYEYLNSLSTKEIEEVIQKLSGEVFIVHVSGGGIKGQAEAIMYGIAKCLAEIFPKIQKLLKDLGFLTRDPRVAERKKPGLRKARKKEQYSKR
jgi:ribosomal protein S9